MVQNFIFCFFCRDCCS